MRLRLVVLFCVLAGLPAGCAVTAGRTSSGRVPARTTSTAAAPAAPIARVASTTPPAPSRTPAAPPDPCARNQAAQLVKVSLRTQHLWMCERRHVAYSTPITSGIVGQYTSTPTGKYTIQALDRNQTLTLIDGSQFTVDYWIPFDAPLFGFHDSPWQHFPYGSARYRTRGSHGCVHMPHRAIAHLYRWAHVGTEVHINA